MEEGGGKGQQTGVHWEEPGSQGAHGIFQGLPCGQEDLENKIVIVIVIGKLFNDRSSHPSFLMHALIMI